MLTPTPASGGHHSVGPGNSAAESTASADRSASLVALAAMALAYALYVGRGGAQPLPIVFLSIAIVLVAVAALTPDWSLRLRIPAFHRVVRIGVTAQFALLAIWPLMNPLALAGLTDYWPYWLGLAAALPFALLAISAEDPRQRWVALGGAVLIHVAIGVWSIQAAPDPFIDVWSMQVEGAKALAHGTNPYLPIYHNIHGADTTYYGPGLVVDGKLTIGFPYPPLSLLAVTPATLLLGDPRYTQLIAIGGTALVLAGVRPGRISSAASLLYLYTPWTFLMVVGSWTEPLAVLLVAIVVLAASRAPRALGISVGLLIAVKQYLLIALPLAALLLARDRESRWRLLWQAVAVATLVTLPFALWNLDAFLWSTVGSLAVQVFRADSLSYLAILPEGLGPSLSSLGFVLLAAALIVVAFRAPRTAFGFAASLSLLLVVFFAFSRQGSGNYHFAVIGALCCAAAASAWTARKPNAYDDPMQRPSVRP